MRCYWASCREPRVTHRCILQANDFERYKELMAQEQDAAANEKLEVIERFLRDTEDYLQRLTEKIASVQTNQEASTAAASATAAARAQVHFIFCQCQLHAM